MLPPGVWLPLVRHDLDISPSNCVQKPLMHFYSVYVSTRFLHRFNSMQSDMFDAAFASDASLAVSAPTGAGKTVLFDLALCRLQVASGAVDASGRFVRRPGHVKAVYIAPMRVCSTRSAARVLFASLLAASERPTLCHLSLVTQALVQERCSDWTARFGPLGLRCLELTGDTDTASASGHPLRDADIILTTPEKFDSVTRRNKGRDGMSFLADVGLLLLDEVHSLGDDRGPALEAVVSRLKLLSRLPQLAASLLSRLRCVGVSATIPNVGDVASWLGGGPQGYLACSFGDEYRATALDVVVHGYSPASNDFLFERNLKYVLPKVVTHYNEGGRFPVLVFCSSRKGAEEACRQLVDTIPSGAGTHGGPPHPFIATAQAARALSDAASACDTPQLVSCLRCGVGYHSAGLSGSDRSRVEALFRSGALTVLCTTSTLAQGVNLPARVVIVKGTRQYDKSEYKEYPRAAILQMIGRAGRPQFDDRGLGVIMTERHRVAAYQHLATGLDCVESRLANALEEHINSEVVAGTISDISQAVVWFKASFLWHRMCAAPHKYGLPAGVPPARVEAHANALLVQACGALKDAKCVASIDAEGFLLAPLPPGQEMARRYVCFNTVRQVQTLPPHAGAPDVLFLLSRAAEFSWVVLRHNEKTTLKQLISKVRYPLLDGSQPAKNAKVVTTASQKLFLLVQDALSDSPNDAVSAIHTLRMEADDVLRHGGRICRCVAAACLHDRRLSASAHSLVLARSCELRMWDNALGVARQFDGIGPVLSRALISAGFTSLDKLQAADPRKLEQVTGRMYPFGNTLKAAAARTPRVSVQIEPAISNVVIRPGADIEFKVHLRSNPLATGENAPAGSGAASHATLLVGSRHDDTLLHWQRASVQRGEHLLTIRVNATVPPSGPLQLVAGLIFDTVVGRDATHVWEWKAPAPAAPPPPQPQQQQRATPAPMQAAGTKRAAVAPPVPSAETARQAAKRPATGPTVSAVMTAVASRGAALGPDPVSILQATAPARAMTMPQYGAPHPLPMQARTPEMTAPSSRPTGSDGTNDGSGQHCATDTYDDSIFEGLF